MDRSNALASRLLAIGDIHGHRDKLRDLLDQVKPTPVDRCVFLGDYIDRGPDSKGVIDELIHFKHQFPNTVFLRGNHDQMLLDVLVESGLCDGVSLKDQSNYYWYLLYNAGSNAAKIFLQNGGYQTLTSYDMELTVGQGKRGFELEGDMPEEHIIFLQQTKLWHRVDNITFVHAGYDPDSGESIEQQAKTPYFLLWDRRAKEGRNGETIVIGHTMVDEPRIMPGKIMIDTGAGNYKALSCIDIYSKTIWQSNG